MWVKRGCMDTLDQSPAVERGAQGSDHFCLSKVLLDHRYNMTDRERVHPRGPIAKSERTKCVQVYLSEEELMEIRIQAAKAGLSASSYIRTVIGLEA